MYFRLLLLIGVIFLSSRVSMGAEKNPGFTQKDFAKLMVEEYSWRDGLSAERSDREYLQILGGRRTFRFEAENAYNPVTDRVTLGENVRFGSFSGKGWIQGVSDSTTTKFTFLLPLQGEYSLRAVIKGNGFVWSIDGTDYRADSNSASFSEVEVGKIRLKAGTHSATVTIPPEGAIDSFQLTAVDHAPIQPVVGWRFRDALTAVSMAEIAVSLALRHKELPDSGDNSGKRLSVAESSVFSDSAAKTNAAYLGKFMSSEWVRADYRGATIKIQYKTDAAGFYKISANIMGDAVRGSVNESHFETRGKPYLDKVDLGLFRLESGDNLITFNLPPMGGIDVIELTKKSGTPEDFLKLAGITGPPGRHITASEARSFLKTLQSVYPERQ